MLPNKFSSAVRVTPILRRQQLVWRNTKHRNRPLWRRSRNCREPVCSIFSDRPQMLCETVRFVAIWVQRTMYKESTISEEAKTVLAAWHRSSDASFELALNDLFQRRDVHRLEDEGERERWELLASICGQLKTSSRRSFEDGTTE